MQIFDQNFISLILNKYFHHPELTDLFQRRMNHIEIVLQEKKNHQEIIKQVHRQILDIDQTMQQLKNDSEKEELLQKYRQFKDDFHQMKDREYSEVQPILGTRLELAIRTLDADLQLIELLLDGKTLTDLMPSASLITTKASRQPIHSIESQVHENLTLIRNNLSNIAMDIKAHRSRASEKKMPQDLLKTDLVSVESPIFH